MTSTWQKTTAISLSALLVVTSARPARSQAQLLLPAVCATGAGCLIVGVVVAAGVTYYVFQHNQTKRKYHLAIDNPEELDQWGIYRARDGSHCRFLAAGRPHKWTRSKCYIKG